MSGRRTGLRAAWTTALLLIGAAWCWSARADLPDRVLVFSRTAGFRHDSITVGAEAIRRICDELGVEFEWTQEPADFTDEGLARFGVIVFLSTTGDVLNEEQQGALERFVRSGRGWVGIHAAADTEYDWPWYQGLVGAAFKSHPAVQPATIVVTDQTHPATHHLDERWVHTDEWYDYRDNPRGRVHVLMSLDERTYQGGTMGHDHPIAWCHQYDGGRAFYTGLGHTREAFAEPAFLEHLKGGIRWALDDKNEHSVHDAGGTVWDCYEVVTLDDDTLDPMELSVSPDGRVVFVERGGAIKVWEEGKGTTLAGTLNVTTGLEDGLLGVAVDPAFAENGWIYVYYAPVGNRPVNRLSRLTLSGGTIDPASEVVMLEIPTQREECCHSGGSLAFGPDGLLYLSTGDNTNPFESNGFAPIDERAGRSPWDAQKSSASTNDLRGKILRIRPRPDGTCEIPDGNLFPAGGSEGRPEIYVMGCRNPFRIAIDPATNWLYFGDVGPDSDSTSEERGPRGHDEWNQARHAGNFGWPYVIADGKPYRDFDFASGKPGSWFDPDTPVNDSPNRNGARELPPAQPAWVWYPYGASEEFPMLGSGGRCAMGGPTYRRDFLTDRYGMLSEHALPRSMDGVTFMYEWARGRIFAVRTDRDGGVLAIEPFLPDRTFKRPHDLELGPDGRLYLIEWGTDFGGLNSDSRISRIDFHEAGRRPPRVVVNASRQDGPLPLKVEFDASPSEARSSGGHGKPLEVAWDFDGDGQIDHRAPASERVSHTYEQAGQRRATAIVRDAAGIESRATVEILAGNSRPRVAIDAPKAGSIVEKGQIPYRVRVDDTEDAKSGGIDKDRVQVELGLRRGNLVTVVDRATGTSGVLTLGPEPEGDPNTPPQVVVRARYEDRGGAGGSLTGETEAILQTRRIEAERASQTRGTQVEQGKDATGVPTTALAFIKDGHAARFGPVRLDDVRAVRFRVASATQGGAIEVRLGGLSGQLIGAAEVRSTGNWRSWETVETEIVCPDGAWDVWLVFRGGEGYLFNLDWIEFVGDEKPRD